MNYTKEIFDILSRGGFISQNSIDPTLSHYYDAIEDDFNSFQNYYDGIGFHLEAGNGYYYFSRNESKVDLSNKIQRFMEWIDRLAFLKSYNTTFGPGFIFRKSNITEKFSCDIELKNEAQNLYPDLKSMEEKMDKLIDDLKKLGFIELENELDSSYKVTSAFHYLEEIIDCINFIESEES